MLKFLGILCLLFGLLAGGAYFYINSLISPQWLEKKAEEEFAGDFSFSDVSLASLWPNTKLVLKGVTITERESQSRAPELMADSLDVTVDLLTLLKRDIKIERLAFEGLMVQMAIPEEGEVDIVRLFEKSGDEKSIVEDVRAAGKKEKEEAKKEKVAKSVTLKEMSLRDAQINILLEKAGLIIDLADLQLSLYDIRVDPSALEKVNEAELRISTNLSLRSEEDDVYALLGIDGPAKVKLFSAETGALDPIIETDWMLSEESFVSVDTPAIRKGLRFLDKLEKIGVKVKDLPKEISFSNDRRLALRWGEKRLDVLQQVEMSMKDWSLAIDEGCWWKTDSDEIDAQLRFSAPEKLTGKATDLVTKFDKFIPKEIRSDVDSPLAHMIHDGRLSLETGIQGSFKKPRVTLKTKIIDISDSATKVLEKGLRSLFK